jgi:hypothetical protein
MFPETVMADRIPAAPDSRVLVPAREPAENAPCYWLWRRRHLVL